MTTFALNNLFQKTFVLTVVVRTNVVRTNIIRTNVVRTNVRTKLVKTNVLEKKLLEPMYFWNKSCLNNFCLFKCHGVDKQRLNK